ncbi:MFS general substrate transporter [Obba rivulosa]|uniref:MFS general substrate transporter n=1 Tax=Obba rivulosa TaxID=1052685 RepID=A0A8E2ARA5_9APHY|nr:MFS general substrate transporter [Obba rivulosa]
MSSSTLHCAAGASATYRSTDCILPLKEAGLTNTATTEPRYDGGLDAWLTVVGGWLVAFCTFGAACSFGVFQDLYTLRGATSSSAISWIGSLQLCLDFAMALPAGKLCDLGYFHHVQIGGGLLYIFSLFMLSIADVSKYYQVFLTQGLGVGIGSGIIYVPALTIQAHHWKKRRALAMGIVISGSSWGGIVYPIMLNQLIHGSAGFAWAVRAAAFMTLGLLAVANVCMKPRFVSPSRGVPRQAEVLARKRSVKQIVLDPPYFLTVLGSCLAVFGLYYPNFYLQLFVNERGLSPTLAFYSLSILNASAIFGRVILNYIADRVGYFNIICPVAAVSTGLLFCMLGVTSEGGVIAFALVYGFFSGGLASMLGPTCMGIGFFATSFGLLLGSPIAGTLLGPYFTWFKPIVFSGTAVATGGMCLCAARQLQVKRKGTQCV